MSDEVFEFRNGLTGSSWFQGIPVALDKHVLGFDTGGECCFFDCKTNSLSVAVCCAVDRRAIKLTVIYW